jgi:uncharacterized protein (DUF1778 family)
MRRLSIDLTDEQHKALKAIAALEGKTMKQFAVERLLPVISDDRAIGHDIDEWTEDEKAAWAELGALLNQRIENAEKYGFSNRSIMDIAEEGLRRHKAV